MSIKKNLNRPFSLFTYCYRHALELSKVPGRLISEKTIFSRRRISLYSQEHLTFLWTFALQWQGMLAIRWSRSYLERNF